MSAVDLDEENLLSPEGEQAPSPLGEDIAGANLLSVKSNENMESIILENSPLEESPSSTNESAPEPPIETPISPLTSPVEETPATSQDKSEASPLEVKFNTPSPDGESSEEKATDISQYFLAQEDTSDPFESISSPAEHTSTPLKEKKPKEDIVRIRTTSESKHEEAIPTPFEECKGDGLKVTQSTKNLCRYFEDSPTEGDSNGKEFFDSFATMETPAISIPNSQPPSATMPPETPPIPSGTPFEFPGPSPMHRANSQSSQDDSSNVANPSTIEASFQASTSQDPFSASLQMSEADRRHDAWIPSEMTRQTLVAMATSPAGSYFPEPSHLTMPGVVMEESLGDPVRELVVRFMGDTAASKRQTLTIEQVPHDDEGLRQLISAECYRTAVDLTTQLLTACGQGPGKLNTVTRHTPHSLQLWLVRLTLLVKLRLHSHAEAECQGFGNLDNPDLYYQFYPDVYPARHGSMASFDLRVLHAELPQYLGKTQESLDRLHYLLAIVKKMLSNLASGLAEDGTMLQLSDASRQASRQLWESRQVRLLYTIGNCLLNIKDFATALRVYEELLAMEGERKGALLSAMGRVYLQMGDLTSAEKLFNEAESYGDQNDQQATVRQNLNKGFLALGNNQFETAHGFFKQAVDIDPKNAVAVNNMAVCLLYMGGLKEALASLEGLVHAQPATYLQDGVLFNLSTLYELESSRALTKKQGLLMLVSRHKGNGFNAACLKMNT